MSELIDRIYDLEKISKEHKEVSDMIAESTKLINGYKESVISLQAEARKAKGTEELINSTKLLNDNVVKGGIEMKRYEAEVQKLKEKTEQLTNSEKAASIEIAKARLELQAANKETKEAAAAQIVLEAKTKGVKENYGFLKKELEAAAVAYKNLTLAEQKTAEGKALLAKYTELKKSVNGTDEALGNFQHKVAQYEQALGRLPGVFGEMAASGQSVLVSLRTKFESVKDATMSVRDAMAQSREATAVAMQAAEKAAIAEEALATAKKTGSATSVLAAEAEATRATATVAATAATEASSASMKVFKYALISTGIGAIVVALGAMVAYFTKTNEGSKEFAKISAGINAVLQSGIKILGSYGKLLFAIATFDLKKIKESWNEIGTNIKNATGEIKENYKAGVQNTANQQMMAKRERTWSGERLKLLKEFEDAKIMAGKRSALDDEGKAKAAKRALQINETIYQNDLKIAKNKVKMVEDEQKLVSKKDYQAIQDAKNKVQEIINAHSQQQLTVGNLLGKTEQRIEDGNKAAVKSEAEKNKEILEAKRKLFDMEVSLMDGREEKSLKISNEKFNREIEDSKATGILKQKILDAQEAEANKIKNEWSVKRLNDTIKADELILENMKRSGEDTLAFEKKLLKKRMDAEIAAGGDANEIRIKYQYLSIDLETQNAEKKAELFQKALTKEIDLLKQGYSLKENELKKQYANGEIDRETYENKLAKLTLDAQTDANQKTIDLLKKQLASSKLTEDKRAELSNQLTDLEIQNEKLKSDAVIDANEKKTESDKQRFEDAKQIATELLNASMEVFTSIADFQKQQSENRIAELEKELEASQSNFDDEQAMLDGAIMSDESRAEQQKIINEKKAAADKAIQDKIVAEKIKMAKWEKAQAIISAIISTAQAVAGALAVLPWSPLNAVFAGLAATSGAVQVATIASQPLPAYEKGTDNHPGGWSLWGEKRAEVAVLPTGQTYLATKPTVTNFDPGTRIFKSVSDYENYMLKQNLKEFVFDYDKMGEKMPQTNINLDASKLWEIIDKKGNRKSVINRRYKR